MRMDTVGPSESVPVWTAGIAGSRIQDGATADSAGAAGAAAERTVAFVDADTASTVEAAGHFRIYLGAAAGVGKTYAMLSEGRRRKERGADVVIGFVECHGRRLTEDMTGGLEVVPRKAVEYRGTRLTEMDTLAAGIDVITTVNIQHLESIADEVEHVTGAKVRERVPDWVVRKANQIELVDSSPEQLRRRMLHGNIYPKEKVSQALTHFFRTENLVALRELALRFVADATERELLDHLRRYESSSIWETTERILVGATGAPGTDAIMRRAARMAARV